jgi:hypothetical protein
VLHERRIEGFQLAQDAADCPEAQRRGAGAASDEQSSRVGGIGARGQDKRRAATSVGGWVVSIAIILFIVLAISGGETGVAKAAQPGGVLEGLWAEQKDGRLVVEFAFREVGKVRASAESVRSDR